MEIRINIGCGRTPVPGWRNYDNSFTVRLAKWPILLGVLNRLGLASQESLVTARVVVAQGIKWADATHRIPEDDGSVSVVYSSHMLEHLDQFEASRFLAEARRVLRPGGVLRLAVPDLARRIDKYAKNRDADEFMASLSIRPDNIRRKRDKVQFLFVGDRHHRWMYDGASLAKLLESHGFEQVAEMAPGTTAIDNPRPLDLTEREDESIYVEGRRS